MFYYLHYTLFLFIWATSHSAGYGGSTEVSIPEGNFTSPTYRVLSAGLSGEVAYYGVMMQVIIHPSQSFSIDTNATGDSVYPFAADGVFDPTFLLPKLSAVVSSGSLTSVSINYYGTYAEAQNGYSPGFDGGAPDLIVDAPPSAGERATVSATVSGGAITAITVESGGSGYDSSDLPSVSIVGGPHLLKVSDVNSPYYGRVFLISDNNRSRLTLMILDWKVVKLFRQFLLGTAVEVVRAPTLEQFSVQISLIYLLIGLMGMINFLRQPLLIGYMLLLD